VLRKTSGSEGKEAAGDYTKLHNEWLHGLYCSPNVIWFMEDDKMDGSSSRNGREANCSTHLQERGSSEDTGTD